MEKYQLCSRMWRWLAGCNLRAEIVQFFRGVATRNRTRCQFRLLVFLRFAIAPAPTRVEKFQMFYNETFKSNFSAKTMTTSALGIGYFLKLNEPNLYTVCHIICANFHKKLVDFYKIACSLKRFTPTQIYLQYP